MKSVHVLGFTTILHIYIYQLQVKLQILLWIICWITLISFDSILEGHDFPRPVHYKFLYDDGPIHHIINRYVSFEEKTMYGRINHITVSLMKERTIAMT